MSARRKVRPWLIMIKINQLGASDAVVAAGAVPLSFHSKIKMQGNGDTDLAPTVPAGY